MTDTPAQTHPAITVAALYQFARFADPAELRGDLLALCEGQGIKGTLLLAREGINGTIAGPAEGITAVVGHIRALPGCEGLDVKYSDAPEMPFYRMKVRLKREIVTMGQPDIDPLTGVGHYVSPAEWNALIADPDTVVIDTRNDYEVAIGTFARAVDPQTASFTQFPQWFRDNRETLLAPRNGRAPRVAMFCTGGIRCEKSTAFLRAEGIEEVYHLKGGILNYLEHIPQEESLWEGECFVFDQRVSLGHGLAQGTHGLCHACRRPITDEDRLSPLFEEGVSCPACHEERSDAQREGYRQRQQQEQLAAARGQRHIGS
ncbi:MAG TPA: rhodanese-related sulfurtransferase [Novosphingobium sp.]|nr:rhodanese-related sulfurtransferase [Novosphingobium sp.]